MGKYLNEVIWREARINEEVADQEVTEVRGGREGYAVSVYHRYKDPLDIPYRGQRPY